MVAGWWSPGNGVSGAEAVGGLPPRYRTGQGPLPGGSTRVAGCGRFPVGQLVYSSAVVPGGLPPQTPGCRFPAPGARWRGRGSQVDVSPSRQGAVGFGDQSGRLVSPSPARSADIFSGLVLSSQLNGGDTEGTGLRWVLDPIDGTINFLHGLPFCAVSSASRKRILRSQVLLNCHSSGYNIMRQGHGSYANNQPLKVGVTNTLNAALVSIDQFTFGAGADKTNRLRHRLLRAIASHVQRVRMFGTSAIDLVWTAQGRLDACIILGNKPWDTSARTLIAREAGARVLDLDGIDHSITSSSAIAVAPSIEHELMTVIHNALMNDPTIE